MGYIKSERLSRLVYICYICTIIKNLNIMSTTILKIDGEFTQYSNTDDAVKGMLEKIGLTDETIKEYYTEFAPDLNTLMLRVKAKFQYLVGELLECILQGYHVSEDPKLPEEILITSDSGEKYEYINGK